MEIVVAVVFMDFPDHIVRVRQSAKQDLVEGGVATMERLQAMVITAIVSVIMVGLDYYVTKGTKLIPIAQLVLMDRDVFSESLLDIMVIVIATVMMDLLVHYVKCVTKRNA
jgi:ribose/xylose/arabinose/galactoside ABC-type transport system permease subunit